MKKNYCTPEIVFTKMGFDVLSLSNFDEGSDMYGSDIFKRGEDNS